MVTPPPLNDLATQPGRRPEVPKISMEVIWLPERISLLNPSYRIGTIQSSLTTDSPPIRFASDGRKCWTAASKWLQSWTWISPSE